MEEHLGYPEHDPAGRGSGNSRNGASGKTVRGDFGEIVIETPRDRNSSFEPKIGARVASPQSPTLRQVRSVYQGCQIRKTLAVYTKFLTPPTTTDLQRAGLP